MIRAILRKHVGASGSVDMGLCGSPLGNSDAFHEFEEQYGGILMAREMAIDGDE